MATYNVTVTVNGTSTSGNTTTQNVQVGDTINLTATYSTSGTWNAAPTDCEVDGSTATSTGNLVNTTVVVDEFTGSTYNVLVSHNVGGDGTTFRYANLTGSVSAASDSEVDSLSFGNNVTGAEAGAVTYRYDQITGINTAVTFSKSSGDPGFEWQVTNNTTQPTSGWGTSNVSVSNNQYVHLKMTASSSYSTTRTATFTIGSPAKTDTISTTTRAANTIPTGWNDVTIGNKSGQDVDAGEIWYADFDGTHTTTSPGAGFEMAGLESSITVTTSGAGDAISKDGTNWTTTSLTISNGETLYARITGSAAYLTGRTQTITPGGGNAKAWTLTTKDNKPDAFDLGDTTGTAANGTYYSNTITVAGLDTSTSVTASLSSDAGAGNFGYLKNGSEVANAANTTAANGDEFQVSHQTKTGNSTVTTTTLNLGSTSDSFTTTNAGNQAGWSVFATSSGYNEGDTVGVAVYAPTTSGAGVDFWWSVSPTDVNASTGNGTTTYYNGDKTGTPPSNIGGFNFVATEDYTDDGSPGTGAITYTLRVFSDSNRTTQVASNTVDINDSSQPLDPDTSITLVTGSQTKSYAAGSDNAHAITFKNGETHTTYAVILDGATIGSATEYGSAQGLGTNTQTISVADDDIAPGNQDTFRVVARRTVANNGDNVQQDTGVTYTISRRAQTPSIDSSALVDAAVEDDDVTWRWTISGGDGGTVKYSLDGAAYAAVSGGQVDLNTTRGSSHTFDVFSDATVDSTTASADTGTIDYLPSDTTNASVTTDPSTANYIVGTTQFTVNIANIVSNISWRVLYGTSTPNTSAGSADANGDIVISGSEFPSIGGSMNYQVQHRRATGVGGDNTWADFGAQFTKNRYTYKPAALDVSHDSLANTYANITLDITPPSTTTGIAKYQVSQFKEKTDAGVDISTPSWSTPVDVAVGTSPSYGTYNQARGDNETDYRTRAVGDNGLNSSWVTVSNHDVGYLNAEAFTVTNNDSEDYAYDATASFSVGFSNTDANHTYQVVYGTATDPTTDGGQRTGNGNITLNNAEYPAAGTDMYYQVRVARATSIGGSGLFVDSGSEFIKGRYPYPASALETFTDEETEAASGDFTVKVTPGTGANTTQITLASDYTSLQDNDTVVSSVVRAGDTIYARSTGANGLTTDTSFTTPETYLSASTSGYSFDVTPDPQAYGAGNPSFDITAGQANHTVAIFEGSTIRSATQTGATDYDGVATNANVAAGGSRTYNLKTKRNEGGGGDPDAGYSDTGVTTTVREYPQTPTGITGFVDQGTEANLATFTVTYSGTTGAASSTITLNSDYTTGAVANGSNLANVDRDGDSIYARNTGANSLTADAELTTAETYLSPDNTITITPSAQSLGATDTSFDITISDIDADKGMYYQVRDSSGTIHENGTPAAGQTSFTLTVTDTPNANPETYDIFSKRLKTSGGGDSYATSGKTFTVAPSGGTTDTAPVISSISQSAGSNSNLKDLTVNLSTPGSGGTALEYASSTTNSIPSSGWQSSATFADRTVGTTYYFWASRNKNTSLFSSSASYTPNNAEYGIIIRNASNQTIVDSRSDKQSTTIKAGSVVIPASTSTVVDGKTYKTVSTLNAALYGAPNPDIGTEWTANANGTFTSGAVVEIVTVTGITGMRSGVDDNSYEIDVITQTPGLSGVATLYTLRRATDSFEVYQLTATNYTLNYIAVRY